jgi:hypothetical protein
MKANVAQVVESRQLRKLQLARGGFNNQERQERIAGQLQHLEEHLDSIR